jgi:capsular exopolysaccharide synthesis family protein
MRAPNELPVLRQPDVWTQPVEAGWTDQALRLNVFDVLRERRLIIGGALALSALLLIGYAILTPDERLYEAQAQLLVEPEMRSPLADDSRTDPSSRFYETQLRILRSRTLARRTLATLRAGAPASEAAAPDAPAAPAAGDLETSIPAADVDRFLRALTIARVPDTGLVDVRYRAADPEEAARVANAHTQAFVQQSVELTLLGSRQLARWILQPLEEQRERLEAGEAELRRFQQQHGALDGRQALVTQRLTELNAEVLRARANRVSRETSHQMVERARRAGRPASELATMVSSPMIQQLSSELAVLRRRDAELAPQYGPRHPEREKIRQAVEFVTASLETEVTRAIEAAARELEAARQDEQKALGALNAQSAEAALLTRRASEYDARRREVASDRALLERLQQRARELNLANDYELSNIRVIDAAEAPRGPMPTTKRRNLAIGGMALLMLSFLVGIAVHVFDERLRSPEDVRAHLGLQYLGMVPQLAGPPPSPGAEPRSALPAPFDEAVRDVRTHVLCTPAGREARLLLVASAGMNEGKTLVATNLATGLAQVGHRVLLVDLDMRHPSVHRAFGLDPQPGLAELLTGAIGATDAIRQSGVRNLWVLTAGADLPRNPGDLLGSDVFRRMLTHLPESFDRVVFDSPPVMAFADASVVAHQQAGVVFVVSADRTGRRAAQAAVDRLEAVGARFVGSVINRVDPSRHGSSYYPSASYYGRRTGERV